MKNPAAILLFLATAASSCSQEAEASVEYNRAIECSWALNARGGIYRDQGFDSLATGMEDLAEAYSDLAIAAGKQMGKSDEEIMRDFQDHIQSSLADAQKLSSAPTAEFLKPLNDQVDECSTLSTSSAN